MKREAVDQSIQAMPQEARARVLELVNYMRKHYPDLEEVVSFQMPTYKLGSGAKRNYIAFSGAKGHVSMHTMDFDMIQQLKPKLKSPGKGKGCVQIGLTDEADLRVALEAIPEIVQRAGL